MLKKALIAFDKALPVWVRGRENEILLLIYCVGCMRLE